MDFAENDWISVITAGSNSVVVAQIESVKAQAHVSGQESGGIVSMRLVRTLGPGNVPAPAVFDAGFLQFTEVHRRMKSGGLGWNGVDVRPGVTLVMGAPEAQFRARAAVRPLAVAEVESAEAPLVRGIDAALILEKEKNPDRRKMGLAQALWSDLPVLGDYAQYAIGRLHRIPRTEAVDLDARLAADRTAPQERRLAAAATLETALWQDDDPRDLHNKRIVGALLAILSEPQPDVHRFAVAPLYRLLVLQAPQESAAAQEYRALLLSGVPQPPELFRNLRALSGDPNIGKEAGALSAALGGR